ncbi:MAG TPA: CcdB family protein [Steroidobacteraceae bacterium]|nr:CcdB family protein [Steroidobacteraceae bacterium]
MPQFAVYRNENPGSSEELPFLVDVQADVLEELNTRVVIPLARAAELTGFPTQYLIPVVAFQGQPYALLTPQLAGILRDELGPQAGSLADQERVISTAIDFLLRGF